MSDQDDRTAITEALRTDGVVFPRGVLGDAAQALADGFAAEEPPDDLPGLVDAAASAHWPELRPAIAAAIEREMERAEGGRRRALERAASFAATSSADNPLARALVVRAAQELGTARRRAREIITAAEGPMGAGGPAGMVAGARAAGAAAVELLDLDPEDFAPEIAAYVDASRERDAPEESDSLSELARATGDIEVRTAARAAVRALDGLSSEAQAALVPVLAGGAPDDAAEDAVWVGAALALSDQAIERALVEDAVEGSGNGAS